MGLIISFIYTSLQRLGLPGGRKPVCFCFDTQSSSHFSSLSMILNALTYTVKSHFKLRDMGELASSRGFFLTVANALSSMKPNCFSNLLDSSVTASKYSLNRSLQCFAEF